MNNKYIIGLILTLSLLTCRPQFLEEPSRTVTIDDLINHPETGADRILGAVYNSLYEWKILSFSWIGVSSITSDEADKGSVPSDRGADKIEMDSWEISPTNLSFNEIWEGNFDGIGRACYAVEFISKMNWDSDQKNRYIAEAKFLRAYYYWNLVRCFGGVPKIDHILSSQSDIEVSSVRATQDEIYTFMIDDLNQAVTFLPEKISQAENGRPSKYAAMALLAKIYLYQKNYGMARSMCDQIILSGHYDLLNDYAKIWREAGEFSSESIWEINSIASNPPKGITGYTEVQGMRGSGDGDYGWGFNVPSEFLINSYEAGDKRKDGTVLVSGTTLWDGYQSSSSLPNKYYNYKAFVSKTSESYFDRGQSNKNMRIARLGEIYLIKAEAENELNNIPEALKYINKLRQRAGLSDKQNITDQNEMRDIIRHERLVEMAFEHDRIFDLRRTGLAAKAMQAQGKSYVSPKHDLFPIPQRQIDLSAGKIKQNDGY